MRPLTTTTIGSFPLPPSTEGFKKSLEIQVRAGVDYPALPQLEDFCIMFLKDIAKRGKGIEERGGAYVLTGLVEPPKEPAIMQDVTLTITMLKDLNANKKIKVQVTGPFTLSSMVKFLDKTAMSYPDLIENFADAIAEITSSTLSFDEVEVVFIDEPILYYALWYGYEENFVVNTLNRIFKKLSRSVERGLHVCGDVRGLSRVTLKLDVDILHHEFAGFPKNFGVYKPEEVIMSGKMLGVGAVTTKPLDSTVKVERVEEVESLLRGFLNLYGPRIVIAPDCGFRGLIEVLRVEEAVEVTFQKLKVMVEATLKLRKERGF
ncbi:MAG: hypothetical protein QXO38_04955 [Candidatus Nezhaarchaeales archaeon]